MIAVESWGIAGSVVDGGRVGRAWLGQSRGGAVDPAALALANRLVGNGELWPAIETSGGLLLRVHRPVMVAVTGAMAHISVGDGPPVGWGSPVVLPAGAGLRVGRLLDGARTYVAVRGGLTRQHDQLTVGPDPLRSAASAVASRAATRATIRVWPGPRVDWFEPSVWATLLSEAFIVTSTSRVGVRLSGAPLAHRLRGQLASEGIVEGAVQVPPDGQPIVMLADHPTTGGYPVIAVIDPADLGQVAQAAEGVALRFTTPR